MGDRSPDGPEQEPNANDRSDGPPPDVADFIRYSYRRRRLGWPDIYDDMCAVAARREFRGWDHARLAEFGVTFSLFDTPRLAAWVRQILARDGSPPAPVADVESPRPRHAEASV